MITAERLAYYGPKSALPWLDLDGVKSFSMGLLITRADPYGAADCIYDTVQVPGRRGDLTFKRPTYSNISIVYEVCILPNGAISGAAIVGAAIVGESRIGNYETLPISDRIRHIKAWLNGPEGSQRIIRDSYNPGYFRRGIRTGQLPVEKILRNLGKASVTFSCQPFLFSDVGQERVILNASGSISNPESFSSLPYIKVNGNGTCTLTVNDQTWSIQNVSGYVEIDSETGNCYKGATNMNNNFSPIWYPELKPGRNQISFGGGATSVEIIPRWCTL